MACFYGNTFLKNGMSFRYITKGPLICARACVCEGECEWVDVVGGAADVSACVRDFIRSERTAF